MKSGIRTLRGGLFLWARRWLRNDRREGFYEQICRGTNADWDSFLRDIVTYAANHVPYYRQFLAAHGGRSLAYLPVLTKQIIRRNFDHLKSDEVENRDWYLNSSGGSSGQPITLLQDRYFKDWLVASERYFYRRFLGLDDIYTSKVVLWGSEKDFFEDGIGFKAKLTNWCTQTTFLNTFKIGEESLRRYVETINTIKPDLIKGYAGSIYQLARFARRKNFRLHKPRAIYSSAESLRAFMREEIEQVFDCKVFDFYGSREVGPIAGECSKGKMHIFNFLNYVEVVNAKNEAVRTNEEGRVLVTGLRNYVMPLIRYQIDDTAILGKPCDCDIESPTLERITGRITDHFLTKDGSLVHGEYFTHLFYFVDWVEQFQILQHAYDEVEIFYVAAGKCEEGVVREIEEKIRLAMGDDCKVKWTEVSEIPRTPHGKQLFTRSHIAQEE